MIVIPLPPNVTQEVYDQIMKISSWADPFISYFVLPEKPKTPIGGDDPLPMRAVVGEKSWPQFQSFLKFLPARFIGGWFDQNVEPHITDKSQVPAIKYATFLTFKNLTDLERISRKIFLPAQWEAIKTAGFYASQGQTNALKAFLASNDPKAVAIAKQYASLYPLGDPGLELRRQNAVVWLIQNGEFDDAQMVIDKYKNLDPISQGIVLVPITEPISTLSATLNQSSLTA